MTGTGEGGGDDACHGHAGKGHGHGGRVQAVPPLLALGHGERDLARLVDLIAPRGRAARRERPVGVFVPAIHVYQYYLPGFKHCRGTICECSECTGGGYPGRGFASTRGAASI